MARGLLYEISTNRNTLYTKDADYVSNIKDRMELECVKNDKSIDFSKEILKNYLVKHGAVITDNDGIIFTKDFKLSYFKERYQRFLKLSGEITLENFATSWLSELQRIIEDKYDDMVIDSENETWYTFDSFIRQADESIPYYVGNIMIIK